MSRLVTCYIDSATEYRLEKYAEESGRTIEDLCECAIAETALNATKHDGVNYEEKR